MSKNNQTTLASARRYAQSGRFHEMLAVCHNILEAGKDNLTTQLDVGTLLSSFGFVDRARECFERGRLLVPDDLRSVINLANLARDVGEHSTFRAYYGNR
jgi:hypothetical protein